MKPMPIRYVRDMDAASRFYEALGLAHEYTMRPPRHGPSRWVELRGDEGWLALHHVPEGEAPTEVELSFGASEPLEKVTERLRAAGYDLATEIVDESFGRSFTVRDPEGLLIQVNEHDRDL
jgi:predicted enzyme related to lactoylglutathione lyase